MTDAKILHTRDSTANDSDKVVLTAGADEIIEIMHMHITYTSTATAGNRQIMVIVQDDSDTLVGDYHAGAVQAASNTYHYVAARGVYRETSVVDDSIHMPIPFGTVLFPGWDLRVKDDAAVAAAADDMTIDVVYKVYDHTDAGSIT